jgi:putative oxidoreductase
MKIVATVARLVLGLMFTVFGLNGFLQFFPAPPLSGLAGRYLEVLVAAHYIAPVSLVQVACGLLFLANFCVPLALTLIGPVLVNILLFHLLMNPAGIGPGAFATVCWFILFYRLRPAFAGILSNGKV